MSGIQSIINIDRRYVVRLYREGHEPLDAFEEDIRVDFAEIMEHFGDSAEKGKIVGQAMWVWLRIGGEPNYRATISKTEKKGYVPVTMIRVHRMGVSRRKSSM